MKTIFYENLEIGFQKAHILFNNDGTCRAIFNYHDNFICHGIRFYKVMLNGIMQYRTADFIRKDLKRKDACMASFPKLNEW